MSDGLSYRHERSLGLNSGFQSSSRAALSFWCLVANMAATSVTYEDLLAPGACGFPRFKAPCFLQVQGLAYASRLSFWVFTRALRDFVMPFTPHQTTPHLSICKIPSILQQSISPQSPPPQQSANCLFIEIIWLYELASADIPSARPKQDRRATEPVNCCAEEICISVIFVNKIADDRHLRFSRSDLLQG